MRIFRLAVLSGGIIFVTACSAASVATAPPASDAPATRIAVTLGMKASISVVAP